MYWQPLLFYIKGNRKYESKKKITYCDEKKKTENNPLFQAFSLLVSLFFVTLPQI
jgi:hypothetical protein